MRSVWIIRSSAIFGIAALLACSTIIPYAPDSRMSQGEARKVIIRVFEEQPPNLRPRQIAIDDDAIRLGSERFTQDIWTGAVAVVDRSDAFYLSSLKRPQLLKRNRRYQVLLSNTEGTVKRWVIFYDEQNAKRFLDALSSLAGFEGRGSL